MKHMITILILAVAVSFSHAAVVVNMNFDNNDVDRGISLDGANQTITFSGGYNSADPDFNNLDGISAAVNFTVTDSSLLTGTLSGTLTPGGGDFNMGASGGGIDSGSGSSYFNSDSEYWTFTFNTDIVLTDVNFYAPDAGQQTILVDGSPLAGSPYSSDIHSAAVAVTAGQSLTFGYDASGTGTYGLADFTFTTPAAVPEAGTASMLGVAAILFWIRRRMV